MVYRCSGGSHLSGHIVGSYLVQFGDVYYAANDVGVAMIDLHQL